MTVTVVYGRGVGMSAVLGEDAYCDPAFEAVALLEKRAAHLTKTMQRDDSEIVEAEQAIASCQYRRALDDLVATRPTTRHGAQAQIRCLLRAIDYDSSRDDQDPATALLDTLLKVIPRLK